MTIYSVARFCRIGVHCCNVECSDALNVCEAEILTEPTIVIVGGGPAGLSTALYLLKLDPTLKDSLLVLERASYPRDKICAGGLIPRAFEHLRGLGISLTVPHVEIHATRLVFPSGEEHTLRGAHGAVISRRDFDAQLAEIAERRGVRILQGVRVRNLERREDGLVISTDGGDFHTQIVVGADGTGSIVRRALFRSRGEVARTMMKNIPVSRHREEFRKALWRFEFTSVAHGLQGYAWVFPMLIGGEPHLNVGLYDQNHARNQSYPLAKELDQLVSCETQDSDGRLCSFPIRKYTPLDPLSRRRVLLVGDAAGVDPLMGEGISLGFDYGRTAANEILAALSERDLSFKKYGYHVWRQFGWRLMLLGFLGQRLYGKRAEFWFSFSRKKFFRERGAGWYLGVGRHP